MTPIRVKLPWAVLASVNDRVNRVGDRLRLTTQYRQAKDTARALVATQTRDAPLLTGPVEVRLRFWTPDNRRRDPDNLLKMLHDAMTGILYEDDVQIRRQVWEVAGVDRATPRVEIEVEPLRAVDHERAPMTTEV
ncbi:MAG TPA: RusA family crossover junction endodeoxyribonuclease [Longimicrobiales bacterium]